MDDTATVFTGSNATDNHDILLRKLRFHNFNDSAIKLKKPYYLTNQIKNKGQDSVSNLFI